MSVLMPYFPATPTAFAAVTHGVVGVVLGKARSLGCMTH